MTARIGSVAELESTLKVNASQILDLIGANSERASIHVTGSIVEGFGNKGSDIDVLVDGRGSIAIKDSRHFFWKSVGRWVDIRFIEIGLLNDHALRLTNRSELADVWRPREYIENNLLDTLHRYSIGIELSKTPKSERDTKHLIRRKLPFHLALQEFCYARARWLDMTGAALSRDFDQARYFCRMGMLHLLSGYCSYFGETYVSSKWLRKKASRVISGGPSKLKKICKIDFLFSDAFLNMNFEDFERYFADTLYGLSYLLCKGQLPPKSPPREQYSYIELMPRGQARTVDSFDTTILP